LPQTTHLFSTWLKWLIGLSTAGIMTLFLLTLGFATIKAIQPYLMDSSFALGSGINMFLSLSNLYWLSLCIYMICVNAIVAGTIPAVSGEVEKKITGTLSKTKKMNPIRNPFRAKKTATPGKKTTTNETEEGRQTTLTEFA